VGFPRPRFIRINSIPTQPENQNRMTERLPDGSVKLVWDKKKKEAKPLRPTTLMIGSPLRNPEISLPNIESVEIPPTIVLDLETTDLDPAKGRILAAGLALYLLKAKKLKR
jgi:hypothetical protein